MQNREDLTRLLWVVGNENWTDPKGVRRGLGCHVQELARLVYRAADLIFRGGHCQPIHRCGGDLLIVNSPVHLRVIRQIYGSIECEPVYARLDIFSRLKVLGRAVFGTYRAAAITVQKVTPIAVVRVATKALETFTLAAKLEVAASDRKPVKVAGFEFGYVGLAIQLFSRKTKVQTAFIQHGFLNRFQLSQSFDHYYLNLEWDKEWIESHLERKIDAEFLFLLKPRPQLLPATEKRLLWCLEYPWRQLPGEIMVDQMRWFFSSLAENGWKVILRSHPYDRDGGKWYAELLSLKNVEVDSHKDLSIEKSIANNRCIAVASFSSASFVEALFAGVLPVLLNHPVREFIVGDMNRLCLCLESQNAVSLRDFAKKSPEEILRLAQVKRSEVFGQHVPNAEPLDAPHPS